MISMEVKDSKKKKSETRGQFMLADARRSGNNTVFEIFELIKERKVHQAFVEFFFYS